MKPTIKFKDGQWMCGGLFSPPWYIDWIIGSSPKDAYKNWKKIVEIKSSVMPKAGEATYATHPVAE